MEHYWIEKILVDHTVNSAVACFQMIMSQSSFGINNCVIFFNVFVFNTDGDDGFGTRTTSGGPYAIWSQRADGQHVDESRRRSSAVNSLVTGWRRRLFRLSAVPQVRPWSSRPRYRVVTWPSAAECNNTTSDWQRRGIVEVTATVCDIMSGDRWTAVMSFIIVPVNPARNPVYIRLGSFKFGWPMKNVQCLFGATASGLVCKDSGAARLWQMFYERRQARKI